MRLRPLDRQDRLLQVVDQEPRAAVLDDLRQGPGAARDDRSPRRHRLDRHEPERLRPRPEHHRRQRTGVQLVALRQADLAEELDDPLVDRRRDDLLEELALSLVVDLGGHPQRQPGRPCKLDRVRDALFRRDAADEGEIADRPATEGRTGRGPDRAGSSRPSWPAGTNGAGSR